MAAASASHLSPVEARVWSAVRAAIASYDASHDASHIARVLRLATRIAAGEACDARALRLVRLAALLHDVGDAKYSAAPARPLIAAILADAAVPAGEHGDILDVVAGVSFSGELARGGGAEPGAARAEVELATRCVQDADRLDAVGAVGLARCFAFGGARGRALYGADDLDAAARGAALDADAVTSAAYARMSATAAGHITVKLLRLQRMLKTATGRRIGAERHAVMERFMAAFYDEIGEDEPLSSAPAEQAPAAGAVVSAAADTP